MSALIGMVGRARSGKDTVAAHLGYARYAFADKMREAALALDPIVESAHVVSGMEPIRLSRLVDDLGWEQAKATPEVRRTLQRLGTEVGRNLFGEDFWVDLALMSVTVDDWNRGVVFTDVRFKNEAIALREAGAQLIRVTRPGQDLDASVAGHASEAEIDEIHVDYNVINDGTLADLYAKINALGL